MTVKNSRVRSRRGRGVKHRTWPSGRAARTATFALLATAATGCSAAAPDAGVTEEETGTASDGLASGQWRTWSALFTTGFDYYEDPGVCANVPNASTVAVLRDSDKKYLLRSVIHGGDSDWAVFDGQTFVSAPACTTLATFAPVSTDPNLFVIAGKAVDNRIYTLVGTMTPSNFITPPSQSTGDPPVASTWSQLGTSSYGIAGDAVPALASSGSRVVIVFRARSSIGPIQRIYLHTGAIPFSNSWSDRITAPSMPFGTTAVGTPAIAFIGNAENDLYDNKFVIMVRTQQNGLVWSLFDGVSTFTDLQPGPGTRYWNDAFLPYSLISDPAVEWDPELNFLTLYYKTLDQTPSGGPMILNTSVPDPGVLGFYPAYFIDETNTLNPTMLGNPRVTMGGGREQARRMPLIRGWLNDTLPEHINQTLISVEDLPVFYHPPNSPYYY